jgi:PRTRC genetic system protein E
MEFFTRLAEAGNTDLTIRIMQKGDKLTMNIMPGSAKSTTRPINITGTGPELDAEFFNTIMPGVKEVAGIVSNLEDVKAQVQADVDNSKGKKDDSAKNKQKQKDTTPEKKEEKAPVEAPLFATNNAE